MDLYLGKLSMWLVGVSVEKPEARQSITGTKHDTSGSVAARSHREHLLGFSQNPASSCVSSDSIYRKKYNHRNKNIKQNTIPVGI